MANRASVKVVDRGYQKTLAVITALAEPFEITVGVHAEDADGGVMMKASMLEFSPDNAAGTPRAWCSGFVDSHGKEFVQTVSSDMQKAIAAKKNWAQRADQLAQKFAADMQANFANLTPENARSTIARKGSSAVGIDTGQLRAAIRGKVGR